MAFGSKAINEVMPKDGIYNYSAIPTSLDINTCDDIRQRVNPLSRELFARNLLI